jgi:hypothetical protein
VITPKDGCKLVVRSSKASGQEEFFVDAVEMVSFGQTFFFRSLERPKAFLVPSNDYEVLEVREARLVLKNAGLERSIKIGGGKKEERVVQPEVEEQEAPNKVEKKKDRKKLRRKRSKEDLEEEVEESTEAAAVKVEKPIQQPKKTSGLSSLLPPPNTLISETIARYKDDALFKDAFFTKEERSDVADPLFEVDEEFPSFVEEAEFGAFDLTAEEEEEMKRQNEVSNAVNVNHSVEGIES